MDDISTFSAAVTNLKNRHDALGAHTNCIPSCPSACCVVSVPNRVRLDGRYKLANAFREAGFRSNTPFDGIIAFYDLVCPKGHTTMRGGRVVVSAPVTCDVCCNKISASRFAGKANAEGYTLMEPYRQRGIKIDLRCPQGHIYNIDPASFFFAGSRCTTCKGKTAVQRAAGFTSAARGAGWVVCGIYVNLTTAVLMRCPQGHERAYKPTSWLDGYDATNMTKSCITCSGRDGVEQKRRVYAKALEQGDTITNYVIDQYARCDITCGVGHVHNMAAKKYLANKYCPSCYDNTMSSKQLKNPLHKVVDRWIRGRKSTLTTAQIITLLDPAIEAVYWDARRQGLAVDHIIPISWFNADSATEIALASSSVNLRALPPAVNRRKSDTLDADAVKVIARSAALFRVLAAASCVPLRHAAAVNKLLSLRGD